MVVRHPGAKGGRGQIGKPSYTGCFIIYKHCFYHTELEGLRAKSGCREKLDKTSRASSPWNSNIFKYRAVTTIQIQLRRSSKQKCFPIPRVVVNNSKRLISCRYNCIHGKQRLLFVGRRFQVCIFLILQYIVP